MKWLAIAFGLIFFFALLSNTECANPALTIVGEGVVTVPADAVTIYVSVESSNDNMTQAQAQVQESMNNVVTALNAAGIKDEDMLPGQSSSVRSVQYNSRLGMPSNNTTVWKNSSYGATSLEKSIIVRLKTIDISEINLMLETAKSAGASAYVAGYGLLDSTKAEAEARQKAVANAKENAEGMATSAGVSLGKVLEISDYQYPELGFGGSYDESGQPGTIDVTSYVVVTYEIVS
jgi:uncharacterized protein YggE